MVGDRSVTPYHLLIECGLTWSSPSMIAAGAAKDTTPRQARNSQESPGLLHARERASPPQPLQSSTGRLSKRPPPGLLLGGVGEASGDDDRGGFGAFVRLDD